MRPGAQILALLLSWIVTTALGFALILLDERRLERHPDDERLERAWTPVSRTAALVYFGLLAIPFHFAKTRGSWKSLHGVLARFVWFVIGIVLAFLVAVVSTLIIGGIEWAFGLSLPAG